MQRVHGIVMILSMTNGLREFFHKLSILVLVFVPLAGVVGAIFHFWGRYVEAKDVLILFAMFVPTTLGITIGYHRMLTHSGFKAPPWLRFIILAFGAMAYEGAPDVWAATHIKHHAHADEEDDPHSPLDGFWHAHLGWLFARENFPIVKEYAPHLLEDPVVRFISKAPIAWYALAMFIPFAIGGWSGLLWGGLVRVFLTTHITWSVNSICHTFGRRDFETTDESRNHWLVGLLAFGEGWHNNHHAFPTNAFHGMRWWQFDLSGLIIHFFERVGLAWDVQRVSHEVEEAHKRRSDAMRKGLHDMREQVIAAAQRADADLQTMFSSIISGAVRDMESEQAVQMREQAKQRLAAIKASAMRLNKKPHLLQSLAEVQQIMTEARDAFQRKAQVMPAGS